MPLDPFSKENPEEHGVPLTSEGRTVTASTSFSGSTPFGAPAMPACPGGGELSQRIGDFILLKLLGEGSAGKVFLARQISLERQVALKVAASLGEEARTMASLEHESIVRVFSETVDSETDQRLLCMQYVAGTTLERVIAALRREDPGAWSGRRILEIIDGLSSQPTILDPAALRDREELASCDFFEAACWLGGRLAEALDYAHLQGVLHRDIKPANILLNQYGRPMLADFSVALHSSRLRVADRGLLGGTFPYMAPEHLDAFDPKNEFTPGAVDQRSDIYSLGVVLFELVTGNHPFPLPASRASPSQLVQAMAAERRSAVPPLRAGRAGAPRALELAVRRCLEPEPGARFQRAKELAEVLEGCRRLRRVKKELPPPGPLVRAASKHPFSWLVALALLPHLVGSAVNIAYNDLRIVGSLTPAERKTFLNLVVGYNCLAYPLSLLAGLCLIIPLYRGWRRFTGPCDLAEADVRSIRRKLLNVPIWVVMLSCAGWLPGGVMFPLALNLLSGPISAEVFGHFILSFTLSGLIAMTYAFFGVQLISLRVLYPQLWINAARLDQAAAEELRPLARRTAFFQLLAGVIPLVGAVMMVGVGTEELNAPTFRFLVTALIALGMAGFGLAIAAASAIHRTVSVLAGMERRPRDPSV